MKILTGYLKGKTLAFEAGGETRPTTDKVRKAIFDILQGYAQGKRVLDLYSGTGAMGLEALSQKASFVLFVEKDPAKVRRIEVLLKRWDLEASAEALCSDAVEFVVGPPSVRDNFDLVFLDPPYGEGLGKATLRALAEAAILKTGGLVFVETGKKEDLPDEILDLKLVRDKKYGQSRLRIYRKNSRAKSG